MGLASAEALAAEGANVAMFARRRELLEREAERSARSQSAATSRTRQHLRRLVETTVSAFGTVDVLVLNSGGRHGRTPRT